MALTGHDFGDACGRATVVARAYPDEHVRRPMKERWWFNTTQVVRRALGVEGLLIEALK